MFKNSFDGKRRHRQWELLDRASVGVHVAFVVPLSHVCVSVRVVTSAESAGSRWQCATASGAVRRKANKSSRNYRPRPRASRGRVVHSAALDGEKEEKEAEGEEDEEEEKVTGQIIKQGQYLNFFVWYVFLIN